MQAFVSKVETVLADTEAALAEMSIEQQPEKRVERVMIERFMAEIHRTTTAFNKKVAEELQKTEKEALHVLETNDNL